MVVYKVTEFPKGIISQIPVLSPGKGRRNANQKGLKYLDAVCAFDIETSVIKSLDQSIMYIWQFQIGEIATVYGRTWDEFRDFIRQIETEAKACVMVFVHNLSYEFQFLKTVLPFDPDDVFAIDTRKVLRCKYRNVEFRCSYLQSNMSLDRFTEAMGVEHKKLKGFDYTKVRYPWTELSQDELAYCLHDVQGLVEAITVEMSRDDDTLYTIPLTSTGYVRRDVKDSVKKKLPHNWLQPILPDWHLYNLLAAAFRGGNTHANRYYTGQILENVHSWDRSSSYPDVQVNCQFPIGKFYFTSEADRNMGYFEKLRNVRKRACLGFFAFHNIRLKDPFYGCPYLSISKLRNAVSALNDNGRVLSADYLETALTDIDFRILEDVYIWDRAEVLELAHSRYGSLPAAITDCTKEYYHKKTSLKGSEGDEYFYMKSKNKLNSIYGMSAQRPVRIPIVFDPENSTLQEDRQADLQEQLCKNNRYAFQSYAWGVWVTAWARYRLHEGIKLVGDGFVYCDTDSVKYIGDVDWSAYNKIRMQESRKSGAFATDREGVTHYMGVYEEDGLYTQFCTLGAKKYAYVDKKGLHLTVAGVNKQKGAAELQEHGGIEAFKEGFIFRAGGRTESVYNDLPESKIIKLYNKEVELTSNIVIKPSTYTLGLTAEYKNILKDAKRYRQSILDMAKVTGYTIL